jgi:hypothetical protein
MYKDREESESPIKHYQNFIHQFRYKGNALAKSLKLDGGTPEISGTQFEHHCYTAKLQSFRFQKYALCFMTRNLYIT